MRIWGFHLAVLAVLFALQFLLPPYHAMVFARIMVLAVFAVGYNIAFGYAGMLSLGHALFFAAGLYAGALPAWHFGLAGHWALLLGPLAGAGMALIVGLLALRTQGVAFMIVTLMFAQSFALSLLYFNDITHGDEGFSLPNASRSLFGLDLSQDGPRYLVAWALCAFAVLFALALVRSRFGRVMVALRENEERSRMLGYNPYTSKLLILVISGALSGLAGAAQALLFGYAGSTFASIQYSILPMLYTLLGGAGTVLGPLLGAAIMSYLTDYASRLTDAWLFVVGAALIALVLFAPKGILGWLRSKFWKDLP